MPPTTFRSQTPSPNTVTATVPVGNYPFGVAYDSANNDIYVTNQPSGDVSVINGSTNTVTATVPVGDYPFGVAYDSANNDIYVTNQISGDVSVINGSTNTVTATVPVGNYPEGVAYDSANNDIYVTNAGSGDVSVITTVVDTDLGITAPANQTVNATSPSGATVNYSVPTTDPDDATAPQATCSVPSGSVFPVGTTTVKCSVTDSEDTPSTVSTSFTVTVLGAKSQLQQLGSSLDGVGPGTSLLNKINTALSDLNSGNPSGAKAVLRGFINEVRAQSGKKISKVTASTLIADAQRIINVIG